MSASSSKNELEIKKPHEEITIGNRLKDALGMRVELVVPKYPMRNRYTSGFDAELA